MAITRSHTLDDPLGALKYRWPPLYISDSHYDPMTRRRKFAIRNAHRASADPTITPYFSSLEAFDEYMRALVALES